MAAATQSALEARRQRQRASVRRLRGASAQPWKILVVACAEPSDWLRQCGPPSATMPSPPHSRRNTFLRRSRNGGPDVAAAAATARPKTVSLAIRKSHTYTQVCSGTHLTHTTSAQSQRNRAGIVTRWPAVFVRTCGRACNGTSSPPAGASCSRILTTTQGIYERILHLCINCVSAPSINGRPRRRCTYTRSCVCVLFANI